MEEQQSEKMDQAIAKINEAERLVIEAYMINNQTEYWKDSYANRVQEIIKMFRDIKQKF